MSRTNSSATAATAATPQNSGRQLPVEACSSPTVGPIATAPKMHTFMITAVQGIFRTGHPVTSGGTAAMSIRLVHSPSAMNAPMNTAPFGDHAASTAAARKAVT